MGNVTQRPASHSSGTDASVLLRALSENPPAGTRWLAGFASLQQALLVDQEPASILPDLLRLAKAQQSCRLQYLNLLDALWRGPATGNARLAQEIRAAEPLLRDWLRSDPQPPTRAAAARLLAAAGGPGRADFLDQCLRLEKDPGAAANILGALHPLRLAVGDPHWRCVLAQFRTEPNARLVRLQAACCCLHADCAAPSELLAELRAHLYCPRERTATHAIRQIASAATVLPREQALRLWIHLLESAVEFDGAAAIACHLLRAACQDRREGWDSVRLGSVLAPGPLSVPARLRQAWAGAYRRVTGRVARLPLAPGELPARYYPDVTAFPPSVDPADASHRAALTAIVTCEPLWQGHTDLWRLFGLPAERAALHALCL